jgi:hypothetical protein
MRINPRAALTGLVTVLALSLSVGAVGALAKVGPVTTRAQEQAQNSKINAATTALKRLATGLSTTNTNVAKDKTTLTSVSSSLTALQNTVTTTISTAVTALGQLQTGLATLSTAVGDTTTGIPGLNNARPLIGAVVGGAPVTGSEFTLVKHISGALGGSDGEYLLSFVNGVGTPMDVSRRVYEVTGANPLQPVTTFTATNCSQVPFCGTVNGSADASLTDVVVVTSVDGRDFQIAAISG